MTTLATDTVDGSDRLRRVAGPMLVAGGLLAASVALHVRDPHQGGSWGYCPWLALTGTYCPGCGGLRAVNDLSRGDLVAAASSNLLFITSLPLFAWLWLRAVRQGWTGVSRPMSGKVVGRAGALSLVLIAVFWVVRNLPSATWLTP